MMTEEKMGRLLRLREKVVRVVWLDIEEHCHCECEPHLLRPPHCHSYGVLKYHDEYLLVIEREMRGEHDHDLQVFPMGAVVHVDALLWGSDDEGVRF